MAGAFPRSLRKIMDVERKKGKKTKKELSKEFDDIVDGALAPGGVEVIPVELPLTAAELNTLENVATLGLTLEDCGHAVGCGTSAFYRYCKNFPEIKERFLRGRAKGTISVAAKLREHIEKGSLPAIIFYLKSRAGWHENNPRVEHVGNISINHTATLIDKLANNPKLLGKVNDSLDILTAEIIEEGNNDARAAN